MSSFRTGTEYRKAVLNRFFSATTRSVRTVGYDQLMSASEQILRSSSDPIVSLASFHQRQILRIVDLYKQKEDAVEVAADLANLRKALTVSAFRLAANGNEGNYALAMGGSVVTGLHTFLTDVDAVVLAHRPEDREAAQKVQRLMIRVLDRLNIEADWAMPMNLDGLDFAMLERRFQLTSREEVTDPFLGAMWMSNSAVFNFLMDIKIVDVSGKARRLDYERELAEFRNRRMFYSSDVMVELCRVSSEKRTERIEREKTISIKNNAFRSFIDALYAFRSVFCISNSSLWDIVPLLEEKGLISRDDRKEVEEAFTFFLKLRHLIGFSIDDSIDSTKLTDQAIRTLSYVLKMEESELLKKVEISCQRLRNISERIFLQLKGGTDEPKTNQTGV